MSQSLWRRDAISDLAGAKTTFSSWDACMSKTYCKYPVIVAIVVGSLIVLSIVWCLARCICCGAECCCSCLSCCRGCCSSSDSKGRNQGYQQPPAAPPQYPSYGQYQSPVPPMYNPGFAYGAPQTATFDAPTRKAGGHTFNEDALPAMPSWDNAATRRVQHEEEPAEEDDDAVEMEKLNHTAPQQQGLLQHNGTESVDYGYDSPYGQHPSQHPDQQEYHDYHPNDNNNNNPSPYAYDTSHTPEPAANAYHQVSSPYTNDYNPNAHPSYPQSTQPHPYQQYSNPRSPPPQQVQGYPQYPNARSPPPPQPHGYQSYTGARSPPPPVQAPDPQQYLASRSPPPLSPVSSMSNYTARAPSSGYPGPNRAPSSVYAPSPVSSYAPSTSVPPSYHTRPPSVLNPGRKPVQNQGQGSWRDI